MKYISRAPAILLFFLLFSPLLPGQSLTGLQKFALSNGMELFVLENHVVPLTRVQIVFRCGAISQNPDTAGLFHLYEHMLFKGNQVFTTQTDFQAAMRALGVSSWNGGTSAESVSYYFTVPSERTEKGIEFWADAVRYPLFNPSELATEKGVVVNEIQGYINDPGNIFMSGLEKLLFWKYPWRKDVTGSAALVQKATVEVMKNIQGAYYIPNNAALFVGGDVNPAAVRAMAEKYFGSWERAKDPWASPMPAQAALDGDSRIVFPDEQMYNGVAYVELELRGPDVLSDAAATYAADALGKLIEDPNGRFKKDIFARVPGLYKKEYISSYYATERDGGFISFSTLMLIQPDRDTFSRVSALAKAFFDETAEIAGNPSFFAKADYDVLKSKLADERILERETVDGFINSLSFWWATASTDYYIGYADNLMRISPADISKYLTDYIAGKHCVLAVRMNPEDYAVEKASALKAGYAELSKENSYWWEGK